MPLFEIQNLSFHYAASPGFELQSVDASIEKGDLVGILGSNGAGKSTLLKLMAGLLAPREGEIYFETRPLKKINGRDRARKIAYVSQTTHFTFPLSVWEIVEMGRHPYLGRFESMGNKDREICAKALELCDVIDFKNRLYGELSGGEKQRVLIASALAQTPQVLLLDEPTLSLDLAHQIQLFEMIQKLHREEALTVIVATHELNLAGRYLDHLILMKKGKIATAGEPRKVLTLRNIKSVLNVEAEKLTSRGGVSYFAPRSGTGRP